MAGRGFQANRLKAIANEYSGVPPPVFSARNLIIYNPASIIETSASIPKIAVINPFRTDGAVIHLH
jgi:hypothetical protein